jgi:hypothetical protein
LTLSRSMNDCNFLLLFKSAELVVLPCLSEMLLDLLSWVLISLIDPVLHRRRFNDTKSKEFSWERVSFLASPSLQQTTDYVVGFAC